MPHLHHSAVPFRQVVGERYFWVGQEAEYVRLSAMQPQQQIMADPARLAAQSFAGGRNQGRLINMEREALGQNGVVTSLDQRDEARRQRGALFVRQV